MNRKAQVRGGAVARASSKTARKAKRKVVSKTIDKVGAPVRKKALKSTKVVKPTTQAKPRPTHPGEILKEDVLPALGVTVTAAAKELKISRQSLHLILAGERPITPDMAVRIGRWCGNGPALWINMQSAVDLFDSEKRLIKEGVLQDIPQRETA